VEAAASAALEAEAKLRQDPLFIIRKKEEEQRRMLLNNPVRLKKLQEEVRSLDVFSTLMSSGRLID
jgi:Pre-mRNA splicing factor